MIFLDLAVSDLDRAKAFDAGLGFSFDEQFSDEKTASVVISDAIVALAAERPHGFMHGTSSTDPDGHVWETVWMDPSVVP